MIRNTGFSNTEDGNVGPEGGNVGNVHQNDRAENNIDVTVQQGRFLRKEPIVLISIVCLSLLNGITMAIQMRYLNIQYYLDWSSWSSIIPIAPIPGVLFAAFLSEVTGRKPVYICLFALSTLSSILHVSSKLTAIMFMTCSLQGIVLGGASVMNALAISEYSSPKHRFSWMIAQEAIKLTVYYTYNFMQSDAEDVSNVLIIVQIVLGLMCLGSTWVWPESPYWLAYKGKLEESRKAFLFLRGEESRKELRSVLEARRRPGPPRLFWTGLGLAIATMSVNIFSNFQERICSMFTFIYMFKHGEDDYYALLKTIIVLVSGIVVFFVLAVTSYFIKRKLLFIVVSAISFVLSYSVALVMYLESELEHNSVFFTVLFLANGAIIRFSLSSLGAVMAIEIVPYKYNTVISCICFIILFLSKLVWNPLTYFLEYYLHFQFATFITLFTTLSLAGALIYYFFAPETKDKTLIEIQKTYTPNENDWNPEQNLSMIQSIT